MIASTPFFTLSASKFRPKEALLKQMLAYLYILAHLGVVSAARCQKPVVFCLEQNGVRQREIIGNQFAEEKKASESLHSVPVNQVFV